MVFNTRLNDLEYLKFVDIKPELSSIDKKL
jgi:hypothetical protein